MIIKLTFRFALLSCLVGACGCYHVQTGPLIGYAFGQGVAFGWEGGAGVGPLGATLGAEVRPFGDRVGEFFLAAEPGFAVPITASERSYVGAGLTGGLAIDALGLAPMSGVWAAGSRLLSSHECGNWLRTASVSVGFHVLLGHGASLLTLYASPKLGAFRCDRIL